MESLEKLKKFYAHKTVLVTGHTGFKGSWLCEILIKLGANVIGYSLPSPTHPNLYSMLNLDSKITSIIGDVRDYNKMKNVIEMYRPQIVFHLAAQPIVRESYLNPRETFEINVMGTVNLLEAIRTTNSVESFVNITTDKVYENEDGHDKPFKEDEKLDGHDPYSNSKSCSELVTHSYIKSFLKEKGIMVSTVRAGNVIGGGDFSKDRIIPDCVRALCSNKVMIIRNPDSIRPYQHVLEPLNVYIQLAMMQLENKSLSSAYNVGPDEDDCLRTIDIVKKLSAYSHFTYKVEKDKGPHEASYLKLDNSKIKNNLGWHPILNIDAAIEWISEWNDAYVAGNDITKVIDSQIERYFKLL